MTLDRIDLKILALYQDNTRRIAESIGADVGLSAAAVQRRLKRMRQNGVIRKEVAVLDGAKVGSPVTCIVTLSMAASSRPASHLDHFRRQMIDHLMVQQCYHVTGSSDFVIVVVAPSMEGYGAFARDWFESNECVTRYDTYVALEKVKTGLSVPITIPDQDRKTK